ncbi:MAG: TldD/PmbA family protein [Elusimicrobiota bacterium]
MNFNKYSFLFNKGDFSDLYIEGSENLSIQWEAGKVKDISCSEQSGAGLRYISNNETIFGHVDGSPEIVRLKNLKSTLSKNLKMSRPKPLKRVETKIHPVKIIPADISFDKKIKMLQSMDGDVRSILPRVQQVNINYGEKKKKISYVCSTGESFLEERTYLVLSLLVTVEDNNTVQTAYEALGGISGFEIFNPKKCKEMAFLVAKRALQKCQAPIAPIGEMPVVISSAAGGTLIHEAVGHSLEADAVLEGTSPSYVGKLGQKVGNSKLTVYDNPTIPGVRGSFYFDDEGVPSQATQLIENGILKDYLFDRTSARRAKRESNGHGRRESYAHRPIPRMSNTYIAPGKDDPQKILESMGDGFLVTRMGGGQVNTANGDFVFEVEEGFRVRNRKAELVRGATLLGNGPEVLKIIDMVGWDHGWGIGTCGKEGQGVPVSDAIPTIRIPKLVVGGGQ